jgi:methyltransferase family protein
MTAWKLFEGDIAPVSTPEFHAHRERAPHLEQPWQRPRMDKAAEFVRFAAVHVRADGKDFASVSDLGCGDGGLLSLIQDDVDAAWGYDFQPSNAAGWAERGVKADLLDVFGADWDRVHYGTITVVTEVLEHLTDPAAALARIREHSRFLVASSPWIENDERHDECHAWAFDPPGYAELIQNAGFTVLVQEPVGPFQVVLAEATQ